MRRTGRALSRATSPCPLRSRRTRHGLSVTPRAKVTVTSRRRGPALPTLQRSGGRRARRGPQRRSSGSTVNPSRSRSMSPTACPPIRSSVLPTPLYASHASAWRRVLSSALEWPQRAHHRQPCPGGVRKTVRASSSRSRSGVARTTRSRRRARRVACSASSGSTAAVRPVRAPSRWSMARAGGAVASGPDRERRRAALVGGVACARPAPSASCAPA